MIPPLPRHISKAEALSLVAAEAAHLEARFSGCALCASVAACSEGRDGAVVLAENAAAIATLDRFAARPGHVVVVLRRHAESLAELPWEEYSAVQRLAWEASVALQRLLAPVRIYVASLGAARRIHTSFPHHHVHVIPLGPGGESDRPADVLTWSHGVHVYERALATEWATSLRAAWPSR